MSASFCAAMAAVMQSPQRLESGPLWSYVVPGAVLLISLAATIWLYRKFSKQAR